MTVRVERAGPVTTVIMDRPEARNAVDGPTAAALVDAFRDFDADDAACVAVLHGAGGSFCAGADLKAIGGPDGNRAEPDGDGPMGPTRMRLSKPVIAAVSGHAVAGGLARAAAEELARELAALPQSCLRSDRLSALESVSLSDEEAMANEFRHGMTVLGSPTAIDGVGRFRRGAGRGGAPG